MGSNALSKGFMMIKRYPFLHYIQWLIGLPVHLIAFLLFLYRRKKEKYPELVQQRIDQLKQTKEYLSLKQRYEDQFRKKKEYFDQTMKQAELEEFVSQETDTKIKEAAIQELAEEQFMPTTYQEYFLQLLLDKRFVIWTFIPGGLLYILCLIYQQAFIRFVFERLVMTIFVIFSVIIMVFTILYISPSDAAANILGESASEAQRVAFDRQYGLDQSYWVQLWEAIKGFLTFDLGLSYTGNENVMHSIANRLPVTLIIASFSLILAILIAVPIGMISAAKVNSFWDYSFMFIALIGLSIPSFWQGLIFILTFSVNADLLPSNYSPGNAWSLIMPIVVLGTGLTATIARMTRSSILEVMHEDYMITAKAKGLSERKIFIQHALRNAWIPILTVIGLQFGVMLGGAAVTEKVFNISGLGSYIVDKQFIPDIPAILGGVVYIAIAISIVNLIVDLLYAVLNPRIRSQMKDS